MIYIQICQFKLQPWSEFWFIEQQSPIALTSAKSF